MVRDISPNPFPLNLGGRSNYIGIGLGFNNQNIGALGTLGSAEEHSVANTEIVNVNKLFQKYSGNINDAGLSRELQVILNRAGRNRTLYEQLAQIIKRKFPNSNDAFRFIDRLSGQSRIRLLQAYLGLGENSISNTPQEANLRRYVNYLRIKYSGTANSSEIIGRELQRLIQGYSGRNRQYARQIVGDIVKNDTYITQSVNFDINNREQVINRIKTLINNGNYTGLHEFYQECLNSGSNALNHFRAGLIQYTAGINHRIANEFNANRAQDALKSLKDIRDNLDRLDRTGLGQEFRNALNSGLSSVLRDLDYSSFSLAQRQAFIRAQQSFTTVLSLISNKEECIRMIAALEGDLSSSDDILRIVNYLRDKGIDISTLNIGDTELLKNIIGQFREGLVMLRNQLERNESEGRTTTSGSINVASTAMFIAARVFGYGVFPTGSSVWSSNLFDNIADRIDDNFVSEQTKLAYQNQLISISRNWKNLTPQKRLEVINEWKRTLNPNQLSIISARIGLDLSGNITDEQLRNIDLFPAIIVSSRGQEQISFFVGYRNNSGSSYRYINMEEMSMVSGDATALPVYQGNRESIISNFGRNTILSTTQCHHMVYLRENNTVNIVLAPRSGQRVYQGVRTGAQIAGIAASVVLLGIITAKSGGVAAPATIKLAAGLALMASALIDVGGNAIDMTSENQNGILTWERAQQRVIHGLITAGFFVPIGRITGTLWRTLLTVPGVVETVRVCQSDASPGEKFQAMAFLAMTIGLFTHAEAGQLSRARVRELLRQNQMEGVAVPESIPAGREAQISWARNFVQRLNVFRRQARGSYSSVNGTRHSYTFGRGEMPEVVRRNEVVIRNRVMQEQARNPGKELFFVVDTNGNIHFDTGAHMSGNRVIHSRGFARGINVAVEGHTHVGGNISVGDMAGLLVVETHNNSRLVYCGRRTVAGMRSRISRTRYVSEREIIDFITRNPKRRGSSNEYIVNLNEIPKNITNAPSVAIDRAINSRMRGRYTHAIFNSRGEFVAFCDLNGNMVVKLPKNATIEQQVRTDGSGEIIVSVPHPNDSTRPDLVTIRKTYKNREQYEQSIDEIDSIIQQRYPRMREIMDNVNGSDSVIIGTVTEILGNKGIGYNLNI